MSYTVGDSVKAFDDAIEAGYLSTDPNTRRFAGNFMYMETVNGKNNFKHIVTRRAYWVPAKN